MVNYSYSNLADDLQGVMPMYCDNQAAIFIVNNPTFHLGTLHIEIACHVIRH
ncbi:unnamed protein product [Spirodela intermedia]|uniref:Uncharacterized protein n=2 Tax=Spirodela intermedia TaxID=51605 RepID=A0A7I8KUJ6_SPIIN|nr:unnamed protein product [Spirodela intermedia]CAA6664722.1 unnamed protein product [Spirodela intermedia]CAA7401321.1 unnamed protein product [Spirodela intermedia]